MIPLEENSCYCKPTVHVTTSKIRLAKVNIAADREEQEKQLT